MNQETKEQSALLTLFYNICLAHLNGVEEGVIHMDAGLCWNLEHWAMRKTFRNGEAVACVMKEMKQQFADAGLNLMFPFNFTEGSYNEEQEGGTIFDNPLRIQWVKDHAI